MSSNGLATKQQSQKIFEKLKTKPANKVCDRGRECLKCRSTDPVIFFRYVLTVAKRILRGHRCRSVSISAWIALRTIATSVFTFPLFDPPISTVCVMEPLMYFWFNVVHRMAMGTAQDDEGWGQRVCD